MEVSGKRPKKASKPDFKNQWGDSTGGTAVVGGVWITPYQSVMIHILPVGNSF